MAYLPICNNSSQGHGYQAPALAGATPLQPWRRAHPGPQRMCNPHRRQPPQAITPTGCGPASTTPTRGSPGQHQRRRPGLPSREKSRGYRGGSCDRVRRAPRHITRPQNRPPDGAGTPPFCPGAVGGSRSGEMPLLAPSCELSGHSGLLSVPHPRERPRCGSEAGICCCLSERGPYGGWGCWGYLPFFPPPPLQPLPRGLLSMVSTYPEDIQMETQKSLVGDFGLRGWSHN